MRHHILKLDIVHFYKTETAESASLLFSMQEFFNTRSKARHLKSCVIENKRIADCAHSTLKKLEKVEFKHYQLDKVDIFS
jgi:hypothetical protein